MIIEGFIDKAKLCLPLDLIAGVATAGIAYGVLVADRMNLPFAYVRNSQKSHGRQNLIEGQVDKDSRVLVIEDLISTGGSSLAAVEALREHGCEVAAVIAIFQYNFTVASKQFEEAQCAFQTLTDFLTLIEVAERTDRIKHSDIQLLKSWYSDPNAWQATVAPN